MDYFFTKRFLPLFITQFLGALNDNLLKNALVVLVTYRLAITGSGSLVTLAAGSFILPFFLFSATAGQLADKFPREKLTRIIKLVEIALMMVAAMGFMMHHVSLLLTVLFGMGMHSAFFGPIKYALLPQHLHADELVSGNAAIEAGTFLAILLGTLLGGVLVLTVQGEMLISLLLILCAVLGYGSSRSIPMASPPDPHLHISRNIFRETWQLLRYAHSNPRIFIASIGISWFWFVGATLLAQFPAFVKDVMQAQASIVTLLLTVFSLGIGLGSFLCSKILRGAVRSNFVPLAAFGMALFGTDLALASFQLPSRPAAGLWALAPFLQYFSHWRIVTDLFLLAVTGGIYIVPLYTILQHDSDVQYRARVIAANNVLNAAFMVGSALFSLAMLTGGFSTGTIFLATAFTGFGMMCYIQRLSN